MRFTVVCVGKLKASWLEDGCREFLERVRHHVGCEVVEVKDDAALAKQLSKSPRTLQVALAIRGEQPDGEQWISLVERWLGSGLAEVVFVIGGADGLPAEVERQAGHRLSLSKLTLPHRLCRLLLLEQLYRALSAIRGEPYHRP